MPPVFWKFILTSREVFYTYSCQRHQFLYCKKRCFPKYGFFSLKMSAKGKKTLTQHVWKDSPSSRRPGNVWITWCKLVEFSSQRLMLAWLTREKKNILLSQSCLRRLSCKHASWLIRTRVLSLVSYFNKTNSNSNAYPNGHSSTCTHAKPTLKRSCSQRIEKACNAGWKLEVSLI